MKTLSIEELAGKLNGKMWVKDDLKRIYIDRGYNTKKMSTKTYVDEVNGELIVKCYIDCPSQAFNWIKSQQEEIIENVNEEIAEIIELSKVELIEARLSADEMDVEVRISYNGIEETEFLTEGKFDERFNKYPQSVFEDLPKTKIVPREVEVKEVANIEPPKSAQTFELGNGKKVKHARFGIGEILEEGAEKVKVLFPEYGEKNLVKKFCNLTYL